MGPQTMARGATNGTAAEEIAAVPFVALDRQHQSLGHELASAFDRVVGRSSFVLGDEVASFEAEFASACGVGHCVGVASDTAALTVALTAAGVGRGDEDIVPAQISIASVLGVLHAGATPVLCDVEAHTGLIDAAAAAEVVTSRTAALIAVHLYGQACDMGPLWALASRHGLLVVEDAAHAHGATYRGRSVGSLGDVAAFSFYPTTNLGALGDAGAVCTEDPEIAQRARQLRNLGQRRSGEHVEVGFNARLDGVQAAFLRVKLPLLESANRSRREHAAAYRAGLDARRLLAERDHTPCVYHAFPMRVARRAAAREHLGACGVRTGVHYPRPAHEHPALADALLPSRAPLPEASGWAREELSLPMFAELRPKEIESVLAACAQLPVDIDEPPSRTKES